MDPDGSSPSVEGQVSISLTAKTDAQRRTESILCILFIIYILKNNLWWHDGNTKAHL